MLQEEFDYNEFLDQWRSEERRFICYDQFYLKKFYSLENFRSKGRTNTDHGAMLEDDGQTSAQLDQYQHDSLRILNDFKTRVAAC